MGFFSLIEAVSNRLNEIPIANGNFIINITDGQLLYDTYNNKRISISSISFIDTEKELLSLTGVKNRLYIAKNTGSIFYWVGSWCSVKISNQSGLNAVYYVSENGSDDNDGLEIDHPAKTLNQIIKSYQNQSDMIIMVTGNISDTIVNISNKNSITIIGDSSSTSSITGNIALNNSSFSISNLKINGTLSSNDTHGRITSSESTRIETNNSYIVIDNCVINNITGNNSSSITINNGTVHESAKAIITANTGSIITIPDDINGDVTYESFSLGKIYKNGDELSSSEQKFVSKLFEIEKVY